jgi:hypothetical protein
LRSQVIVVVKFVSLVIPMTSKCSYQGASAYFLRVYDMPAPNESVAGRVCRVIAGLMIGGDWQEVNGWSRLPMSELQGKCSACEDDQKVSRDQYIS